MADPTASTTRVTAAGSPGATAAAGGDDGAAATDGGAASSPPEDVVTFTLDGRTVTAPKGEMLIAAAERAGTFIPRFCYHPRMASVGVCRMCLVEVSGPRGATLQPSCFVEVAEGAEVTTDSPKVKKAQDGVLEFLLVNHPLDCPVCDKGGECPLQDQTLAYGPGESRFVEEKRHFEKPIPISELVLLDRERCIQCSRCTRFAGEVAGEAQIDFAGRGELLEVATFPDHPFTSYFSGNTVQICPVGALTAAPYRFSARPWDLDQVESTCTTCAVGCRVAVQSSANRVTRLLGIDADPVNHGWLCDKGRFAYETVNGDQRLTEPLVRKDGRLVAVSWHEALAAAAAGLKAAAARAGDARRARSVGVLGGARLTNEAAYLWTRLAKGVLGTDSVDAQMADGLPGDLVAGLPRATIDEMVAADTVVVISGDLREELPVLFLRLLGAARAGKVSVIELAPQRSAITPSAAVSLRYRPGDVAAVARALVDDGAPVPDGIDPTALGRARELAGAPRVVVVLGRPTIAEHEGLVADAALTLTAALPGVRFLPALRRGNVHGAIDMGMAPGLLPGRVGLEEGRAWFAEAWGSVPSERGLDARAMLAALAGDDPGKPEALVVLGADPLSDFPDRAMAERALDAAGFLVAVASTPGPVVDRADVVLPAAAAHERAGTTTNVEGRVSRVAQKLVPPGQAWADWMIAVELAAHIGTELAPESVAAAWDEIERVAPAHRGLTHAMLDARGAEDGVVVPLGPGPARRPAPALLDPIAFPGIESVERQGAPPRAGLAEPPAPAPAPATGATPGTGAETEPEGTARPPILALPAGVDAPHVAPTDAYTHRLTVGRRLYDLGDAVSSSPSLARLVEATALRVSPHDLDDLGVGPGDRIRLRTATTSIDVEVDVDPMLPRKVVAADWNVPLGEVTAGVLVDGRHPVVEVRLESIP